MTIRSLCCVVLLAASPPAICAHDLPTFTEDQKVTTGFLNEMLGVRLSCDGLQCGAETGSGSTRWIYRDSGLWTTSFISTSYANSIRGNLVASLTSESSVLVQVWSPGTSYPAGDSAFISVADAEILSISSDRLAVSRPFADTVEMYHWSFPAGWAYTRDFSGGSYYGDAIGLDQDTLAIGVPESHNSTTRAQVEVYDGFDAGAPNFHQILSPVPSGGDTFGASVSVSGSWLAVGAPFDDGPGQAMEDIGAVHLYEKIGSSFVHRSTLYGEAAGDRFGTDVQLDGDRLVVGAPLAEVGSINQAGMVTFYRYRAGAWPLTARFVASDASAGAQLGTAVALSDLGVVASAPYAVGHAGASNAGAVYAFDQASGLIFADGFADGTGRWSVTVP